MQKRTQFSEGAEPYVISKEKSRPFIIQNAELDCTCQISPGGVATAQQRGAGAQGQPSQGQVSKSALASLPVSTELPAASNLPGSYHDGEGEANVDNMRHLATEYLCIRHSSQKAPTDMYVA